MNKLILLTGPSGVGKTPIFKALGTLYPALYNSITSLVLYNSRKPRPNEQEGKDYYFRDAKEIVEKAKEPHFFSFNVRGDTQGVDVAQLRSQLETSTVFYEGNPFVAKTLVTEPSLEDIPKVSVFVSPLSAEEITLFAEHREDLEEVVTDIMRYKLLQRTQEHTGELSDSDVQKVENRARSAYSELQMAGEFDHVLVNHDGEESPHWQQFTYPIGDARLAVVTIAAVLRQQSAPALEQWDSKIYEFMQTDTQFA